MSSEPTRRFQRSHERPRTAREITADVDPETVVRLGESRYHDAVVFPDGSVLGQCSSVDADLGTLRHAANRGLRPCQSCSPGDYLADPETEDIVEDRTADELEAPLEQLGADDAVGLTWQPLSGGGPITAEGKTGVPDDLDAHALAVVDSSTHKAPLVVRHVPDGGEDDTDNEAESNSHASALAETLRQANDDDLEAAGVDPNGVPDEDGGRDE